MFILSCLFFVIRFCFVFFLSSLLRLAFFGYLKRFTHGQFTFTVTFRGLGWGGGTTLVQKHFCFLVVVINAIHVYLNDLMFFFLNMPYVMFEIDTREIVRVKIRMFLLFKILFVCFSRVYIVQASLERAMRYVHTLPSLSIYVLTDVISSSLFLRVPSTNKSVDNGEGIDRSQMSNKKSK